MSGNGSGRSGEPAGGILLVDADGTANVFGIILVAPEAEGLGLEQVEKKPGETFLVNKGKQGLPLDRVEAGDAKVLQFLEGLLIAEFCLLRGHKVNRDAQ